MSRRGTVYDERDYYEERVRRGPPPAPVQVREREYEEVDIYSRREREPDRRPDFLREDYARTEAGPVVLRERETETFTRPPERRPRSPSPIRYRERVVERELSPPSSESARTKTRIDIRERRRSSPPPPERLRARVIETRERVRERSPSPVRVVRERFIERERSLSPPPPPTIERIRIRDLERQSVRAPSVRAPTPSPSPSPSPPPSIRAPPIHQEIITHHRHIDHGFEIARDRVREPARVPTPPPPPRRSEPRTKETDIDIYTSRNNTEVDITRRESRGPERPPLAPAQKRDTFYDDSYIYEQERDKLRVRDREIDITRSRSAVPERQLERQVRSLNIRDEDEADYYARKVDERAYIGEAYNGATKDWSIVDVPPGTERVQMDGIGGGSQQISWQKYNGVRRSKFIPERERERVEYREDVREERPREREIEREHIEIHNDNGPKETDLSIEISRKGREPRDGRTYEREYERIEEVTDRRVGLPRPPPKPRDDALWTEITKDLVVREAIEEMGYDFEETEFFYYIIQYLRYEDVLQLVELSENIRKERQHRIREIERERERERLERREEWERRERRRDRDHGYTDERIIEREVIYDNPPPRRRW